MFNKFGIEWAEKAIKYLTGKKAVARVRYIKKLIKTKNNEFIV